MYNSKQLNIINSTINILFFKMLPLFNYIDLTQINTLQHHHISLSLSHHILPNFPHYHNHSILDRRNYKESFHQFKKHYAFITYL